MNQQDNPKLPRLTVVLTFLMENWSEGKAPPYSPMTSPPKPGVPDRTGILWANYGGHAGIARLMHVTKRHGLTGTVCINARSAELFPETVRHVVASGFDIGGHNYAQDQVLSGLSQAEERDLIRRCLGILTDISGTTPTGWLSSTVACNDWTAQLLAEEKLLWHGDYNDIDLPHRVNTGARSIVAIPHSDFADNRVLRGAPDSWFNCYKDMVDYQYDNEPGSMINITMHGNFGGRPLMSAQLDKLLTYIMKRDDVWFPRHDQLAQWVDRHGSEETPYQLRYPDVN